MKKYLLLFILMPFYAHSSCYLPDIDNYRDDLYGYTLEVEEYGRCMYEEGYDEGKEEGQSEASYDECNN